MKMKSRTQKQHLNVSHIATSAYWSNELSGGKVLRSRAKDKKSYAIGPLFPALFEMNQEISENVVQKKNSRETRFIWEYW